MAVQFPFRPDWSSDFTVRNKFLTEIITSRSKREQRIAARQLPRREIEFSVRLMRDELQAFQGFMAKNQQGRFYVTDWTRFVTISAPVSTGGLVLTMAATPGWLKEGQRILLRQPGVERLLEVESFDATTVTVVGGVNTDFPVGAKVYCVHDCTVDQNLAARAVTSKAGEASLVFYVKPGTIAEETPAAPVTAYGREFLITRPNWSSEPAYDLQGFMETVDYDFGVTDEFAPVAFNTRVVERKFTFLQAQAAEDFMAFHRRMRGMRGEFYAPTWEHDLPLGIGTTGASNVFRIEGHDIFDQYAGSPMYRAMVVFYRNGTRAPRRITSIVKSGTETRINLQSTLPGATNNSTAYLACFMPTWRFSSDELALNWRTSQVAECVATMQTVEDIW